MTTERWDKARVRQTSVKRTKYRAVGPIGVKLDCATPEMSERARSNFQRRSRSLYLDGREISTCPDCGYHVCSCKPQFVREEPPFQPSGMNSVARGEAKLGAHGSHLCSFCKAGARDSCFYKNQGLPSCTDVEQRNAGARGIQAESYGYRNPNDVTCNPIRGEHRPDVWRVTCMHCGVADGFCKGAGYHQECADKAEKKDAACWRRNDGREFHMLGCRNGQRRCPLQGM